MKAYTDCLLEEQGQSQGQESVLKVNQEYNPQAEFLLASRICMMISSHFPVKGCFNL